jgi:hypothetical protein
MLATAILLQALKDVLLIGPDCPQGGRIAGQRDALEWFFSEQKGPGSLHWVSQIIQVDIEKFREWLRLYDESDETQKLKMAQKLRRVVASRVNRI